MKKVFVLIGLFLLSSLTAQAQSLSSQFLSDREYNKFVEDASGNVAVRAVVSASNSPTDEDCLTYEETGSTTEWQACSGSSATAYDAIGDPDDNSTIAFGGFVNSWTTNETASDFFNITNSGNFGDVSLMVLQSTGNPTDGTMFEIINTDTDADNLVINGTQVVVRGSGNVGIGTSAPTGKFEVVQSSVSNLKVNASGELQGDPLADQQSNILAGVFRQRLTAEKLLLAWLTPATTEQDLSGNNHDATYNGTMTTGDQLFKGLVWSLDFDGTDDYLSIADHNDFSFGDGSTDSAFSVCGWIEISNTASSNTIFSKWDETTGSQAREYRFYYNSSEKLVFIAYDESSDIQVSHSQTNALSSGYHFVCMTYDGTGGATAMNGISFYVEGKLEASSAANNASYVAMENLGGDFLIGANLSTSGSAVNLLTSDLGHFFMTAEELTLNDIQEMYLASCGYYNQCTIGF